MKYFLFVKNTIAVLVATQVWQIYLTSGFWPRVRARALRAPVFLGSLTRQTGRYAPPRPLQLRCSLKKNIPETKCFPSGPNRAASDVYLSTGLSCTLLSYIAPYWATMYPPELPNTLMSYAAPSWSTLHPSKLCCIQQSYAAPSELSCTLLS